MDDGELRSNGYIFTKVTPCRLGGAYSSYRKAGATALYDVYGTYSHAKERAYDHCRELYFGLRGVGFRIVSYNSQIFTVGFEFPHPETGELCFGYITPSYNRWCYVSEL